jgi:hypothetical protein
MAYNLRVESDEQTVCGDGSGVDNDAAHNFNEFSITPSSGLLPPQSKVKLLVEFVPHFIKKYDTWLIVDVEDVGDELMRLPISARSSVPALALHSPQVDMGRCFIYYPYERVVQISNETQLRARYCLVPSRPNDPFKFTSKLDEASFLFANLFSFNCYSINLMCAVNLSLGHNRGQLDKRNTISCRGHAAWRA